MDPSTPLGCHKRSPHDQAGDIDEHGDIVGRLRDQLPHADGFDLDAHLQGVARAIRAMRELHIAERRAEP